MTKINIILSTLVIILVSVCVYLFLTYNLKNNNLDRKLNTANNQIIELQNNLKNLNKDLLIDPQKFYAIFLSNGEYYFAKLRVGGDYFILKDVYFLSNYPDLKKLGISQETAKIELKRIEESELKERLVRANLSQIQSPERLNVLKKEVIYYEQLSGGSKVVQAIRAFEGE